ncbi:1,2-phenylacetyl-CoA epoxidase subunit PaaC [Rhodohalobacter sulfatireducens]|uniref:Phenylacetate-CoA oxygenase subunit PaaC n=1 Tax=Rhodohalobacter sulfatireducens TaxID=2911366 RepID=A0ABS9KBC8_9BACT|nr:1,2-phenylacetyl-CoA epoxidase subunit PaaC [Rhodohalobacter sulfatireducens]MCG2588149.1 phenylacetate-CoA oxygenase subunit PaaC [Rhodohalobacter sulfatireducens]
MSTTDIKPKTKVKLLVEMILRLADDRLIHGHRLSEWTGHGPELEEDLALANMALDMIGHAAALYGYAAGIEGKEDEDYYAYFRDDIDFKNVAMVELPKGDFAFTMARQFLFSAYSYFLYQKLIETVQDEQFNGMLQKHFKEIKYHLRHSREWILRLGDGTEESHKRIQGAFDEIWMYTGELFDLDEVDQSAIEQGLFVDVTTFKDEWKNLVNEVLEEATLDVPDDDQYMFSGARQGRHTEYLGRLLAEMQFLRRSYPDAEWK